MGLLQFGLGLGLGLGLREAWDSSSLDPRLGLMLGLGSRFERLALESLLVKKALQRRGVLARRVDGAYRTGSESEC